MQVRINTCVIVLAMLIFFRMEDLLSTREAAEILEISDARVRQLIYAGKLPSQKIGQMNLIKKSDLELVKDRKTGRPPKDKEK